MFINATKRPIHQFGEKNQVFYQGYTGEMRLSLRLGLSATSRRKPTELLQYHSGRCRKVVFMSGVNLIHVSPTPRTCIMRYKSLLAGGHFQNPLMSHNHASAYQYDRVFLTCDRPHEGVCSSAQRRYAGTDQLQECGDIPRNWHDTMLLQVLEITTYCHCTLRFHFARGGIWSLLVI